MTEKQVALSRSLPEKRLFGMVRGNLKQFFSILLEAINDDTDSSGNIPSEYTIVKIGRWSKCLAQD